MSKTFLEADSASAGRRRDDDAVHVSWTLEDFVIVLRLLNICKLLFFFVITLHLSPSCVCVVPAPDV